MKRLLFWLCSAWLGPVLAWIEHLARANAWLQLACKIPLASSNIILGRVEIHGTREVHFGERAFIYPGLYLETQRTGSISLGDNIVISRGVHLVSHYQIKIGAGSMLGEYSSVRDANHHRQPHLPLRDSGFVGAPIVIGKEVWIGRGAIILPGVHIGDGATVAANAVVTRDVAAGTTVAGIPAKVLKPAEVLDHVSN